MAAGEKISEAEVIEVWAEVSAGKKLGEKQKKSGGKYEN